jgi:hypothetical protein
MKLGQVGAAEGCDLLILVLSDQKIAAFGSSYRGQIHLLSFIYQSTLKINLTNISSSETLQPFG